MAKNILNSWFSWKLCAGKQNILRGKQINSQFPPTIVTPSTCCVGYFGDQDISTVTDNGFLLTHTYKCLRRTGGVGCQLTRYCVSYPKQRTRYTQPWTTSRYYRIYWTNFVPVGVWVLQRRFGSFTWSDAPDVRLNWNPIADLQGHQNGQSGQSLLCLDPHIPMIKDILSDYQWNTRLLDGNFVKRNRVKVQSQKLWNRTRQEGENGNCRSGREV